MIVAEEGKRQYHSVCSLPDNKEALVIGDHNEAAKFTHGKRQIFPGKIGRGKVSFAKSIRCYFTGVIDVP